MGMRVEVGGTCVYTCEENPGRERSVCKGMHVLGGGMCVRGKGGCV